MAERPQHGRSDTPCSHRIRHILPRMYVICLFVLALGISFIIVLIPSRHPTVEHDPYSDPIAPSDAMRGLDFWSAQRAYPAPAIPGDRFYAEFIKTARIIRKTSTPFHADDIWTNIGPQNQGGRMNSLAIDPGDPDIVYAGSASGGLWRCTQSGESYVWEYIDTGYPVLGVNAIAVDPGNSDILYIGTGEVYGYQSSIGGLVVRTTRGSYGIGLLKSTDRGISWRKSIDWSLEQQRGILSIELNPLDPDIVFAGTTEGTYRSLDGGTTWQKVHAELMAVDVAINPADTQIVYVSCGNLGTPGTGIYRSMEGGREGTWIRLNGLPPNWRGKTLLDIYRLSPNVVYADIANDFYSMGLYRSTDHGETWTRLSYLDYAQYQGWFSHYVRVHPSDSSQVMCGGVQFYRSSNGGRSFERRYGMHVDHHTFANHPDDPDIIYFGNDGGVYRTTNGGDHFESINRGYVTTQFYNGFSSSPTHPELAIGGLQDNSTVIYRGLPDWSLGHIGGDGCFTAIDPLNELILYGSYQWLNIYSSTNQGFSWRNISTAFSGSNAAFVAPFVLAPSDPTTLYAGDEYVYRSTNRGGTWLKTNGSRPLNGNPVLSIAVAHDNPDHVYAATAPSAGKRSEVFRTTDGGITWSLTTGSLPDRYIVDIVVSPYASDHVFIALSGFGSSHLYLTEDGGTTWTDIGSGLPDVPTSAVLLDPVDPDVVYVGNDLGVFVSTDRGDSWMSFNDGLPSAVLVMDLSVSPMNRKLRAVTHGNGVFERTLLDPSAAGHHDESLPFHPSIEQNYPNPFNMSTAIPLHLPEPAFVTVRILNLRGHTVRTLAARTYPAGRFILHWDGCDSGGRSVPSGPYLIQLDTGSHRQSIRSLLTR